MRLQGHMHIYIYIYLYLSARHNINIYRVSFLKVDATILAPLNVRFHSKLVCLLLSNCSVLIRATWPCLADVTCDADKIRTHPSMTALRGLTP